MSRGGGKVCFQQECEDSQSTQRLEEPCFCGYQTLFSAPLISSWIAAHSWLVAEGTTQSTGNQKDPQICFQTMQQARTSHYVSPPPIFLTPDSKHPGRVHSSPVPRAHPWIDQRPIESGVSSLGVLRGSSCLLETKDTAT